MSLCVRRVLRGSGLTIGAVVLMLCLVGGATAAQEARPVASGAGSFASAEGLSTAAEADADQIAALEQQAFREFRWDVMVAADLALAFEPSDPAAAEARLMVSTDGETFQPLPDGQPVQVGQVVSLIVSQPVLDSEAGLTFPASDWLYEISARALTPSEEDTVGPILLPIAFGDDLGCTDAGCGEDGEVGSDAPGVAGEPRSGPGEASASAGTPGATDRELARELQTELARVGCYTLAVDGLWGPGSRRAMEAFNTARQTDLPLAGPTARALVAVARETEAVCDK